MAADEISTDTTERLHRAVLERWNARDPAGYASLFERDGHVIGFDGSEMHGPAEIESALEQIFADHQTASYVAKVRHVRPLAADVALLRAVVGMIPPGQAALNPSVNSIQVLLATRSDGTWRVSLLQNTPAQYHGRPEAAEALTAELSELL